MTKLSMQDCGSRIAVFVEGDSKQEVEYRYNSLYNFGASDNDPHKWTDTFGYVWATESSLEKYFETSSLFELLGDPKACAAGKGISGGLLLNAKQLGQEKMKALYANKETVFKFISDRECYQMGSISAEKEDSFSEDKD